MVVIDRGDEEKQEEGSVVLWEKLCEELVVEILVRLPTRAAVRSQVVCKRWYSLVSSPSFISRFIHMRHHQHIHPTSTIVFHFTYYSGGGCKHNHCDFQIISDRRYGSLLRDKYGEHEFHLSYLPCPRYHLQLKASFADLVLCSYLNPTTNQTIYYISNLLTTQWIALPPPPPPPHHSPPSVGFLCLPPSCSHCTPLALPYPNFNFMVVRLCSDDCMRSTSKFKVQIFSSHTSNWTTFTVSSSLPLQPHLFATCLVAYRGMLHWLHPYVHYIVVYDPFNTPQTFSRIIHLPTPIPLPIRIHRDGCFGVSQGRLRLVDIYVALDTPTLDVWELQDYDSGLWNLVYKVHLQNLIHNGLLERELCCFSVLNLHPHNGDVIYLRILNGAVLLNMKTKIIEDFYPIENTARFSGWVNAFHFTDQWWPTTIPSLH